MSYLIAQGEKNMPNKKINNLHKPTISQIKTALEQSGYLLEQRICPIIEKYGYFTIPNDQYEDKDTGKSREIDVVAGDIYSLYRTDLKDVFETNLLIECKNNSTPVVFFTQKNLIPEFCSENIMLYGNPDGIYNKEGEAIELIWDYFNFGQFHHYAKAKWIAHQFCQLKPKISGPREKQIIEWETSHETESTSYERLHESIDSLTKAADYFKSEFIRNAPIDKNTNNNIELEMIYPVILFAGQIFECRIMGKEYKLFERKHLLFNKKIQSKTLKGSYYIDVIQENYLSRFLNIIQEQNVKIVDRLKRKRKILKDNVKRNYDDYNKKIGLL